MEDVGGGGLAKRPAALLLRQGPEGPPPRPDLDPKLYLKVDGESSGTRPHLCLLYRSPSSLERALTLGLSFSLSK